MAPGMIYRENDLPTLLSEGAMVTLIYMAWGAPKVGSFVEVGVYQGGSAQYLYDIAKVENREVWLFDTFAGIPSKTEIDQHQVGDFKGVTDEMRAAMRARMPDAHIVEGVFPASTFGYREVDCSLSRVAFVHADADQYESTRDIIKFFRPRMVPGGLILFDDYPYLEGCKAAVDEFAPERLILPGCGRALAKF